MFLKIQKHIYKIKMLKLLRRQQSYRILSLFLIKRVFSTRSQNNNYSKSSDSYNKSVVESPQVPNLHHKVVLGPVQDVLKVLLEYDRFLLAVTAKEKVILSVNGLNSKGKMTLTNINHLPVLQLEVIKES